MSESSGSAPCQAGSTGFSAACLWMAFIFAVAVTWGCLLAIRFTGTQPISVTDRNLGIFRALKSGEIERIDLTEDQMDLFREMVNSQLSDRGIGNAHEDKWNAGKVGDYVIINGSAKNTHNDIYVFLFVLKKGKQVYGEIGVETFGVFPDELIPITQENVSRHK
jgi:hypothetical protein